MEKNNIEIKNCIVCNCSPQVEKIYYPPQDDGNQYPIDKYKEFFKYVCPRCYARTKEHKEKEKALAEWNGMNDG